MRYYSTELSPDMEEERRRYAQCYVDNDLEYKRPNVWCNITSTNVVLCIVPIVDLLQLRAIAVEGRRIGAIIRQLKYQRKATVWMEGGWRFIGVVCRLRRASGDTALLLSYLPLKTNLCEYSERSVAIAGYSSSRWCWSAVVYCRECGCRLWQGFLISSHVYLQLDP